MTDISVVTTTVQAEDLSWDLSNPGVPYDETGTLDPALFTQAQHFANGFIPSGCALGKVTATGRLGPYLDAASDGRQTCVGYLKASVKVVNDNGVVKGRIGVAVRKAFAVVKLGALPFNSTNQALGGYIDAAGQVDLPRIQHVA